MTFQFLIGPVRSASALKGSNETFAAGEDPPRDARKLVGWAWLIKMIEAE